MFFLWIVHDSSSHVPNWYTRELGDSNLQPTCHTFLVLSAHKPHLAPSSYMIVAPYDRCLFSSNRALLVVFPCYHDASISRHLCWWCVVLRRRTHQCNKQDHTTMACLRIMMTTSKTWTSWSSANSEVQTSSMLMDSFLVMLPSSG
jgi:fucose 4-O-acetylase-like acetyltransferase